MHPHRTRPGGGAHDTRHHLQAALEHLDRNPAEARRHAALAVETLDATFTRRAATPTTRIAAATATDRRGYKRAGAIAPGWGIGREPGNKGQTYPADPPNTEEIVRILALIPPGPHGDRLRALVLILWRAGLRINEALHLQETDLDRDNGTVHVRVAKGGKPRTVGIDDWVWPHLDPWLEHRRLLPVGSLFCILTGPTAGRRWNGADVRKVLHKLGARAGVRRRIVPHAFRHALAVELVMEGVSPVVIQRQLGHANLQVTTVYLSAFPQTHVIQAMRTRPIPVVPALTALAA